MSITTQRITPLLLLFLLLQLVLCSAQDPIYKVVQLEENTSGFTGELKRVSGSSPYGNNVDYLSLQVEYLTSSIVHVKITDVEKKRWQVPLPVGPFERNEGEALNYKVKVPAVDEQFNFQIFSSVPGQASYPVFDTTDLPFIFSDQYIQFGSSLPGDCKGACEPNIYGLGERVDSLKLDTNNKTYTIWNHDNLDIPKTNLYGQHPFYLEMRNGLAHGAFLLNSNAMDIQLNWKKGGASNQIIYKVIGGVIDLYFMVGPKPMDVVRQYQEIIGKPFMPPFWVFGFHQCRWGYKNIDETMNVVKQYQIHDIPLETMWNDIDYMDHYKDFTFDPVKFPMNKMKQFTDMLRQNGQHYIVIVDPGIKTEKGYPAYDLLIDQKLYIATADGKTPLQNIVWPGYTVFPDFTNDKTHDYWRQQIHKFFDLGVEIDALWIDMNEPGTFCNGQCYPQNERPPVAAPTRAKSTFDPTNPPYTPGIYPLEHKTLSLNATTSMGPFYNTHSLYGYLESIATRDAITSYPRKKNQRPFVLSRSSFAGSGKHVAHWTGDNYSTYESMKYSISGIISMQLFGITMVGSDICGFTGNTTEELCTRWMQLGSFYPFSRNHNAEGYASQEPYMFGQKLIEVSRRYLLQRYSLLQWYYTVFFRVNQQGGTFWSSLWMEFPQDATTLNIDSQFVIGGSLLVSPVLESNQITVNAYFPSGIWYDLNNGAPINGGSFHKLAAPLDQINCHVRGGSIIARQHPENTLNLMKFNKFTLTIALNETRGAFGELFLDDGITLDAIDKEQYALVQYMTSYDESDQIYSINSNLVQDGYADLAKYDPIEVVTVYGISSVPCKVLLNGKHMDQPYLKGNVLTLRTLNMPMTQHSWNIQIFMKC